MIPPHTAAQLARDWRGEARGRFWGCRSAASVRDAFRDLWHDAEGAGRDGLLAIEAEFQAALRRFGQGADDAAGA